MRSIIFHSYTEKEDIRSLPNTFRMFHEGNIKEDVFLSYVVREEAFI